MIAYDYLGASHYFVYGLETVKDYAHFKRMVPRSEECITMVIPFTELRQPVAWGKPVAFNPSDVQTLQWVVTGVNGDSNSLSIDKLGCWKNFLKLQKNLPP